MPILKDVEVKTFRQHAMCECGKGELLPSGAVLLTDPLQYPHTCNACGAHAALEARYPIHFTRPVE